MQNKASFSYWKNYNHKEWNIYRDKLSEHRSKWIKSKPKFKLLYNKNISFEEFKDLFRFIITTSQPYTDWETFVLKKWFFKETNQELEKSYIRFYRNWDVPLEDLPQEIFKWHCSCWKLVLCWEMRSKSLKALNKFMKNSNVVSINIDRYESKLLKNDLLKVSKSLNI